MFHVKQCWEGATSDVSRETLLRSKGDWMFHVKHAGAKESCGWPGKGKILAQNAVFLSTGFTQAGK